MYLDNTILGSKDRKEAIARLRKRAHFEHNQDVLRSGQGTLLVERRDGPNVRHDGPCTTANDYWACPECLGFFYYKGIRNHVLKCNKSKAGIKTVKVFYQAMLKLAPMDKFDDVLSSMAADDIGQTVKSDGTILKFGRQLYEKYEHSKIRHVSSKMREVGRVLLELRRALNRPTLLIREVILEILFDDVVKATRSLCKLTAGQKLKSIPSLALKIGHSMKKMASLVMNESIRIRDEDGRRNAKAYLQLHVTEWGSKISRYALDALVVKKKLKALPLTSDLQVW